MEFEPFRRKNSIRDIVYRSLRIPRKKKPPENTIKEKIPFTVQEHIPRSITVHARKSIREDVAGIFDKLDEPTVSPCNLSQFFLAEGKPYDKDCALNSFERKMRSHLHFGVDHRAKEQLFCPEQASQIELHFQSEANQEIVLRVIAPNGESSNLIRPSKKDYVCFNPTKVGCGHGRWLIDVAVRQGCRFRHAHRRELYLKGQGMLMYHIDPDYKLRQVDRLWLAFR